MTLAAATGGAAIFQGGAWFELHLIADGVVLFYVAMLFETKKRQDERISKVRTISAPQDDGVVVFETAGAGGGHS